MKREILGESARSTLSTAREFGAMLLPFTNKDVGAARINASLKSFAKPGTWFAPMWAIMVGAISSGNAGWNLPTIGRILLAMFMAGPLLCAFSQVLNDYYDRDVDRINEPERPTAANLLGGRAIALVALMLGVAALSVAYLLGPSVAYLALGGLVLAWVYSAPPLRLKARDGWIANTACALAYEGFAWVAGAAAFGAVSAGTVVLAVLFSLGAHGLMTLNDFKSLRGDLALGLRSIPAMLGERGAIVAAVAFIDVFQVAATAFVALHVPWQTPSPLWIAPIAMAVLLAVQIPMQRKLATDPAKLAPWYCASAIPPFCWSMLASALAVRYGGF